MCPKMCETVIESFKKQNISLQRRVRMIIVDISKLTLLCVVIISFF